MLGHACSVERRNHQRHSVRFEVGLGGLTREATHDPVAEHDDVIDRCRRGDPVAQHHLFSLHKDRVYSLAMFLCRDDSDAAEITQDVFVKVFSNISQFRGEAKFETWLYRIVANTALDYARRSSRLLFFGATFWSQQPDHAVSLEQRRAHSQLEERVRMAIASLPEKLRLPVVLRYVEDLGYEEISAVLKVPSGTVAARLSRAHKLLASKLASLKKETMR
jgi:RNA polymerase sigma-70 factor, ECF subfamily